MAGDASFDFDRLKIEVAAQDPDLIATYELAAFGDTSVQLRPDRVDRICAMSDDEIAQLRYDIRRVYGLSPAQMRQAIGRCIATMVDTHHADIGGMKLGKDMFRGEA
jgi:hypothetical protein